MLGAPALLFMHPAILINFVNAAVLSSSFLSWFRSFFHLCLCALFFTFSFSSCLLMSKSFDVSLRKVRMSGYAIKGHGACKFATPYHFGLARVLFQLGQSVTKWNIKLQGGFDPARVVFRLG